MNKIALLITTIARPKLMEECITSWCEILPVDKFCILIADQGSQNEDAITTLKAWGGEFEYYSLPYDAGIGASRNYLVEKALARKCDYAIIGADSIHGCAEFDVQKVIGAAKVAINELAIVGFNIINRIPWTYAMVLSDQGFMLDKLDSRTFVKTSPRIKMCDICANFFIAQTKVLAKVKWDEELKLAEHEDFFFRLGQAGYLCAWTDEISGQYVKSRNPEYDKLRNRLYHEYKKKLMDKYEMTGWFKINEN